MAGNEEESLLHGGKVMPVWDHLAELRRRVVRSMVAVVLFFGVGFALAERIIGILQGPLMAALPEGQRTLHFTGPMDVFMANLKVGTLVGILGGCPVWLYQFWKFFEPALYPRERRYILPFIVVSTGLFFLGMAFCFWVALPISLHFLISLGLEAGTPMITIKDYLSLVVLLTVGFGLVFEAPVLLVLLSLLDLVNAETLARSRRVIVVVILIVAAILTPPDPVSQLLLAVPLYVMFEAALVVIKLIKGRQSKSPAGGTS